MTLREVETIIGQQSPIDTEPVLGSGLITEAAKDRLLSWGLVPDQLLELEGYVLRYKGKYKMCPEKVSQISTIYLENGLFHRQTAVVPFFYDFMGRRTGGQCSDITNLLFFDLNVFGFTNRLHSSLQTENVKVMTVKGSSRYHFSRYNSTHLWVGITEMTSSYMTSVEREKMVVVDPSYQVIDTIKSINYEARATWFGYPNYVAELPLSARIPIHNFKNMVKLHSNIDQYTEAQTLGISADENFAFGLGFGKFNGNIFPFIEVWHKNSTDRAIYFINPNTGLIEHRDTNEQIMRLSDSAQAEIRLMLSAGQAFTYKVPTQQEKIMLLQTATRSW